MIEICERTKKRSGEKNVMKRLKNDDVVEWEQRRSKGDRQGNRQGNKQKQQRRGEEKLTRG
jgi:hypothetical protein